MTPNNEALVAWRIEYDNDISFDDGGFLEWWTVTNGVMSFKADTEDEAKFLVATLSTPPAPRAPSGEPEGAAFTADELWAAWHGAGVDIAGGNWSRFVGMLPERSSLAAPAPEGVEEFPLPERERHEALGAALERAARDLPDGYDLQVCVERGAGWAELYDPDGNRVDLGDIDSDNRLVAEVRAAINAARASRAEKEI